MEMEGGGDGERERKCVCERERIGWREGGRESRLHMRSLEILRSFYTPHHSQDDRFRR
jgi:hypothetical protein